MAEVNNAPPAALTPEELPLATSTEAVAEIKDVAEVETAPTTSATAEPVGEPETSEPAQSGKSRAQERIEELAGTNKILREQLEYLRRVNEEFLNSQKKSAPPVEAPVVKEDPLPTLESVDFDVAKHADALAKWTERQVQIKVQQAISNQKIQEAQKSKEQIVLEAAEKFRQSHVDFDLLINSPTLQWTQPISDALKELGEDSPQVGYYLAKNPDKLAKIAKMQAGAQAVAIGRIASEVLTAPKAPTPAPAAPKAAPSATQTAPAPKPRVSQAPPPPEPVSGGNVADIDPMTLSAVEWRKWRNAEVAKAREEQGRGRAPR